MIRSPRGRLVAVPGLDASPAGLLGRQRNAVRRRSQVQVAETAGRVGTAVLQTVIDQVIVGVVTHRTVGDDGGSTGLQTALSRDDQGRGVAEAVGATTDVSSHQLGVAVEGALDPDGQAVRQGNDVHAPDLGVDLVADLDVPVSGIGRSAGNPERTAALTGQSRGSDAHQAEKEKNELHVAKTSVLESTTDLLDRSTLLT